MSSAKWAQGAVLLASCLALTALTTTNPIRPSSSADGDEPERKGAGGGGILSVVSADSVVSDRRFLVKRAYHHHRHHDYDYDHDHDHNHGHHHHHHHHRLRHHHRQHHHQHNQHQYNQPTNPSNLPLLEYGNQFNQNNRYQVENNEIRTGFSVLTPHRHLPQHQYNHRQQVPEQLPIVVSSSDNSYVSASPIELKTTITTASPATTTTIATTTTSKTNSIYNRIYRTLFKYPRISTNSQSRRIYHESSQKQNQNQKPAQQILMHSNRLFSTQIDDNHIEQNSSNSSDIGASVAELVEKARYVGGEPHYSKIVYSHPIHHSFNGKRQWHDSHVASIRIGQEDYVDYGRGDLNSAIIAIMFGIGATGILIVIVGQKMKSIRSRIAYKGRRRSLVPDAGFLINTIEPDI